MRWELRTSGDFDKAARKIDRAQLTRIRKYLEAVCELDDPRSRGKGLTGELTGYWRYRIGEWRVLVEIKESEIVIVAVALGHRSTVYRR
ncbi:MULTISPECIES: type II toxin-antitoxin system RelE family toxin [Brevibacterium]|uniref:Type II toxin-antitoxin system RelE/ParE family toxin n=1 Tax=Brevibacterium salitolerans TaxID=1403566 RepID=A0ABP5IF03_9MICO|nr:type II toxin-antitoxin system RelE/ParE family toxin [Brevibacterium sp.]